VATAGAPASDRLAAICTAALVVPDWKGLTGQVQLDVKSIAYGRLPEVLDLKGRLVIEPQRLALENVMARLGTEAGQLQLHRMEKHILLVSSMHKYTAGP